MKKSKFTESQIIKAIKENESGRRVEDICRDLGISTGTFYTWRRKYSVFGHGSQYVALKGCRSLNVRMPI